MMRLWTSWTCQLMNITQILHSERPCSIPLSTQILPRCSRRKTFSFTKNSSSSDTLRSSPWLGILLIAAPLGLYRPSRPAVLALWIEFSWFTSIVSKISNSRPLSPLLIGLLMQEQLQRICPRRTSKSLVKKAVLIIVQCWNRTELCREITVNRLQPVWQLCSSKPLRSHLPKKTYCSSKEHPLKTSIGRLMPVRNLLCISLNLQRKFLLQLMISRRSLSSDRNHSPTMNYIIT